MDARWWFQTICLPLFLEILQFHKYFQMGWNNQQALDILSQGGYVK